MNTLDPELLAAFVTTREAGSLTAAARRLFRSQSALSEQIRRLEDACGSPLFHRGKKGVTTTAAGERLFVHAQRLLAMHEAAWRDLRGAQLQGELRLAITDYFQPGELAGLLKSLRLRLPGLRLHVSIRSSDHITLGPGAPDFDLGVVMRFAGQAGTGPQMPELGRQRLLRREPLAWVAAADALPDPASPLPLVVLPDTCSLRRFTVHTLEGHGVPHFIAHSASGLGGLQLALAAGLGASCLNASAIPPNALPLAARGWSLPALPPVAFFLLAPVAGASPLVDQAFELFEEVLQEAAPQVPLRALADWPVDG